MSTSENCSWTSPDILVSFFRSPFRLDSNVYQRGFGESAGEGQLLQIAHLLYRLAIGKDFIDNHIELAKVVLAKPVSIPTDGFQQNALKAIYWQIEGDIPFWIEVLADGRSGLFRVSKGYNQILLSSAKTVCLRF